MSKKFTVPQKFERLRKTSPDIDELMKWYEDKLSILERRQETLSNKLSNACRIIRDTGSSGFGLIADSLEEHFGTTTAQIMGKDKTDLDEGEK